MLFLDNQGHTNKFIPFTQSKNPGPGKVWGFSLSEDKILFVS